MQSPCGCTVQLSAETVNALKIEFDRLFSGLGRMGSPCTSASHSPTLGHRSTAGKECDRGRGSRLHSLFLTNNLEQILNNLCFVHRAQRGHEHPGAVLLLMGLWLHKQRSQTLPFGFSEMDAGTAAPVLLCMLQKDAEGLDSAQGSGTKINNQGQNGLLCLS